MNSAANIYGTSKDKLVTLSVNNKLVSVDSNDESYVSNKDSNTLLDEHLDPEYDVATSIGDEYMVNIVAQILEAKFLLINLHFQLK